MTPRFECGKSDAVDAWLVCLIVSALCSGLAIVAGTLITSVIRHAAVVVSAG
jgi:hypothetical protein